MKAKARAILIDIPDYAEGDQELWTPKLVKDALVDAFRMLRRVGGRVGPAQARAYWPEFQIDQADFMEQSIAGTLKEKPSPPAYRTRMSVTRMEHVLFGWRDDLGDHPAWLAGPLLEAEDLRYKLVQWVHSELREESTTDLCLRKGWALASFKRHRDRAAGVIAIRLNKANVPIW